ncbi:MAG: hypothetical protein V3W41_04675 [Planctomycetota bacterium]
MSASRRALYWQNSRKRIIIPGSMARLPNKTRPTKRGQPDEEIVQAHKIIAGIVDRYCDGTEDFATRSMMFRGILGQLASRFCWKG